MSSRSRYSILNYTETLHKNKKVKDITASNTWEGYQDMLLALPKKYMIIPAGMEARADLLSHHAYGTSDFWWVICVANNVIDPFEQLTAGKQITVPLILI